MFIRALYNSFRAYRGGGGDTTTSCSLKGERTRAEYISIIDFELFFFFSFPFFYLRPFRPFSHTGESDAKLFSSVGRIWQKIMCVPRFQMAERSKIKLLFSEQKKRIDMGQMAKRCRKKGHFSANRYNIYIYTVRCTALFALC